MLSWKFSFVAVLIMLLMDSCAARQQGTPTVKPDEAFSLKVADSVLFQDGETRFWLSLQKVEDNRCPKEVNCITGGKATAVVRVENQPEPITFCAGSDCFGEQNNSFTVEYNKGSYTIVLEEVRPYPQAGPGLENEAKQTIFKIKRATS